MTKAYEINKRWRIKHPEQARNEAAAYAKKRRLRNPEKFRLYNREWKKKNPLTEEQKENHKIVNKRWAEKNKQRVLANARKWRAANREKLNAAQSAKRAKLKGSMPKWADFEIIELIYFEAKFRGMEVDHVIPKSSKIVCGLHVHTNMQLLRRIENIKKGNKFVPYSEIYDA